MTDCSNAEIRDQLPDYVNDTLSPSDAAIVESHLASCADCSDEIAILRAAVAVRPRVAAIDVAKIVASLPRVVGMADASIRAISSAPSVVRKSGGFRQWRAVAAVAVIAVGGMSVEVARHTAVPPGIAAVHRDTVVPVAMPTIVAAKPADVSAETSSTPAHAVNAVKNVALSVGELSDFSDDEIEKVMARLDKWDGATSAYPLPGVPLFPGSSGGMR